MNKILKIAIIVVLCLIVILTITLFACQNDGGKTTTTTTPTTTTTKPTTSSTTTTTSNNGDGDIDPDLDPECTEHVDENKDYVCDKCEATLEKPACTEHKDENEDEKCDLCGATVEKPECTEHKDENKDGKCDECGATVEQEENPVDPDGFTDCSDTVYVVSTELNIRTSPEIKDDNIVSNISAKMDEVLKRTGYNGGWSRVEINGEEYYVSSDCVVVGKPITEFTPCDETVYYVGPYASISLRHKPTLTTKMDYSYVVGTIKLNDSLRRLGVAKSADISVDDSGEAYEIIWAKVEIEIKGEKVIAYINNKYLTVSQYPEEGEISFDAKDDYLVITAESYGLRTSPEYLEDQSNVGQFVIAGTLVHRTGRATEADADGITWSRVEYNGKVLYMNAEKTAYAVAKGSETAEENETIDGFFESTYSITLPKEFDIVAHDGTQYIVTDGETAISIANSGEAKDMTIEEFAQAVIQTLGIQGVDVQEKDGVTYFEFAATTTVGTETINEYYLVVFTVGTENNYFGTTFGREGTKADNEADFWGYAATIKAVEVKD